MNKHPHTPQIFSQVLAKRNLPELCAWFFLCVLIASIIIGFLYDITEPELQNHNYYYWFQEALLVLSTVGSADIQVSGDPSWHGIVNIFANFLGLMVPALFLGSIVYRLVTPNQAFIFRNKISLYSHNKKGEVAAIRFYNSTTRPIVNVTYDVFARIPILKENGKTIISNKKLDIIGKGLWPIASDRVPFTAYIKVEELEGVRSFYSDDGAVSISDVIEILVLVSGVLRDTSSQVSDSKTYNYPEDFSETIWKDVDVDIKSAPELWDGWNEFDEE